MSESRRLTPAELDRVKTLQQVVARQVTVPQAAAVLQLSDRQIQRLCRRLVASGPLGLAHQLRGRPSNFRLPQEVKDRALALVKQRYADFGPTFAAEKLPPHGVTVSHDTLRRLMIADGVWTPHRQHPRHRAWRERRACPGELIQADGSQHAWFEDRGPQCVLLAFIDDATSRVPYAVFVESECTETLMRATWMYLDQEGRPIALYVDKDSIFKTNREATVEEQLRQVHPDTQYARALRELGIELIWAHSPQAKGRIERLFGTFQDRLVKELRLRRIQTITAGNRFLWTQGLADHNRRFAVAPVNSTNVHRPVLATHHLPAIFSLQGWRTVQRDFTLAWHGERFQLERDQPLPVRPGVAILVEHRLDRSVHLRFKRQYLRFHVLPVRPTPTPHSLATPTPPSLRPHRSRPPKPGSDHPWRKFRLPGTPPPFHCG